jgi:hypothetical protein
MIPMCRRNQKKNLPPDDDGSTIADMNVEGFHWYQNPRNQARRKALNDLNVNRKERWAMMLAGFLAYLPTLLIILFGFGLAFLLMFLWMTR